MPSNGASLAVLGPFRLVWGVEPSNCSRVEASHVAGDADVFVQISAVERAGLRELKDGQKITYELVADRKSGRISEDNLQA